MPVLREADRQLAHGRRLALVDALAPRWGVEQRATGTVVWFEVDQCAPWT